MSPCSYFDWYIDTVNLNPVHRAIADKSVVFLTKLGIEPIKALKVLTDQRI